MLMGYSRQVGRWQEASYLLARMRTKKLVPNSVTCNMAPQLLKDLTWVVDDCNSQHS
jgi:pentatricopeptide repeat protein